MAAVQMFLGGLILGPVVAAQAGLAWYLVVAVVRVVGHWLAAVLPPLRWELWPFLRTGYVLVLGLLTFAYVSGSSSGPADDTAMLAALLGVAASFGVALFVRHRGWDRFGGPVPFSSSTPPPPPPVVPAPPQTWAMPPESPSWPPPPPPSR